MKKLIPLLTVALCLLSASATQYSKLSLITAAKQAGRWDALKAWIAGAGLQDEFQNCAYLSDDYPQFAQITNAIVAAGAATEAEVIAILSASQDTAIPDELLCRVYESDMANVVGRTRWHGKIVETIIDTNALVKTQIHADGYRHVQHFESAKAMDIGRRISSAERKARQEAKEKARQEAIARRKAERIALLQTNLVAETSALMQRNRWPEELARLYLLQELSNLLGTVELSTEVRPQN